jgi:hypothetical protein
METGDTKVPRPEVLAVLVAVLAAVTFAPAAMGGWIFDDRGLILANARVHSLAAWRSWFTTDFWDAGEPLRQGSLRMMYWRPAVTASYALDWEVGGGAPVVFHVMNLVWHGLVSALAFLTLRRWTSTVLPAFFAACLFAFHPTKAESVAWISGRTDILCAAAILLASYGASLRLKGARCGLALEIAATVLAYLLKEQAIVLAAFVAVEAWVAMDRPALDAAVTKKLLRAGAPQLGLAIVYLGLRARFMPINPHPQTISVGDRGSEFLETMGRFFELILAPHDLSVQQALIHTSGGRMIFSAAYVAMGAVVLGLAGLVAFGCRKRIPAVTVGLLLFLATILPTANVVPTGLVTMLAERFLYLPSLGIALVIAALLARCGERWKRPGLALAGVGAVVLGGLSAARAADFGDERTFWARELKLHPDSMDALEFTVREAFDKHQFAKALRLTARAQAVASRSFPHRGLEADFIVQACESILRQTADHDGPSLRTVDTFLGELADGSAPLARVAVRGISIELPLRGAPVQRRLKVLRPRVLLLRADLASRQGDDALAFRFVEAARASCPGCAEIESTAAIVGARAGDYALAHRSLAALAGHPGEARAARVRAVVERSELLGREAAGASGPSGLMLRAQQLASLEAWGRAYDVLAPYKDEIKSAPGVALGFAELAWRAGEPATARDVLAASVPPDKVDTMTSEWSKAMGWTE